MTSYFVLWLSEEILMHNETEVSTDLFFLCVTYRGADGTGDGGDMTPPDS